MQRNLILGSEFILYDIDQRPLAYCKNTVLSLKANLIDITSKDSKGWTQSMMGNRDWNIDFEGLVSHDDAFDTGFFMDKMLSGEPFFVKFGVLQDHFEYSFWGEVNIESINQNADADDIVNYEGKLKGIGDLQTTNEGSPEQNGYLKVESDPIFRGSPAFNITNQNKVNWNTAFDKTLLSIEFSTSNNTTTLFATLRDGSKYSSAFINAGGSGGSGEITTLNFNTNNGNLKVNNLTTSLDGRYQTIGDYVSNTFLSSNFYNKTQSDDRFYLKTNPDGYLTKETATLDGTLKRGNTSGESMYLSGDAYFSKQLSIPTVLPSNLESGKHYIYSSDVFGGTGSTGSTCGVSFFSELADISLSNLANGQSPIWNSTSQKWENKNVSVDLSGYALKTGTNATGNWNINVSSASALGNYVWNPTVKDSADYLFGRNAQNEIAIISRVGVASFLGLGNAAYDNRDTFLRASSGSADVQTANFAIGSAGARNFIQSHGGAPLDLNPLGNGVTINGNPIGSFAFKNSVYGSEVASSISDAVNDLGISQMLRWKNYSNGHVIFDASSGTSPSGTVINPNNPNNPWASTYPTLMGWNGAQTYGLRVDSSRIADNSYYALNETLQTITERGGTTNREITAPTFHANNWFRSAGDTGWYSETYAGGIYMTDASWVRVYGGKGFTCSSTINGGRFESSNGYKSYNHKGMAGDYDQNGYTDKIIWTIGDNWDQIDSMYGIGYSFATRYASGAHQIVFKEAGTVKAAIGLGSGNAYFDGTVTAAKIKATQNLAIPIAPPISPEAGTHYIYSSI